MPPNLTPILIKATTLLLLALLTLLTPQSKADGVLCQNRDFLSSTEIPGSPQKLTVVETTAYVLTYGYGLHIYDVENQTEPQLLSSYETPNSARNFVVQGNYAYIADGRDGGLHIVDVSDPSSPTPAGSYLTDGVTGSIAISGNTVFIGKNGYGTFAIRGYVFIDVTDPHSPTHIRSGGSPGAIDDLHVQDDTLFFLVDHPSLDPARLHFFDISDLTSPRDLGSYPLTRHEREMTINGNIAYMTSFFDGTSILDVSDLSQLKQIGLIDTDTRGTQIIDNHAFTYGFSGIKIYDTSDPSTPSFIRNYDTPEIAQDIFVSENITYLIDYSSLHIINTSELSPQPSPILGSTTLPEIPNSISLQGTTAYLASGLSGLHIIDGSTPSEPTVTGQYDSPGFAYKAITAADNITYLADGNAGLHILDTTDKSNPTLLSTINIGGSIEDIAIDNNRLYLADRSSALHIFNIQSPSNPILLNTYTTPSGIYRLAASNNTVIIATSSDRAFVLNATDPDNITIELNINEYYVSDIVINQFSAIVMADNDGSGSATIVNIQDPNNIHVAESHSTDISYLANFASTKSAGLYGRTLHVLDPSDQFSPIPLGWAFLHDDDSPRVRGIAITSNQAFVIDNSGLLIIDISDCPPCPADLNNDKILDIADIIEFIDALTTNNPIADFTNDGQYDFFDISAFLTAFSTGCP